MFRFAAIASQLSRRSFLKSRNERRAISSTGFCRFPASPDVGYSVDAATGGGLDAFGASFARSSGSRFRSFVCFRARFFDAAQRG